VAALCCSSVGRRRLIGAIAGIDNRPMPSISFRATWLCLIGASLLTTAGAARHAGKPAVSASAAAAQPPSRYRDHEAVKAFAAEVAERRQIDRTWLLAQLEQAQWQAAVTRLIMPPPAGTAKNWALYRDRFIEPRRIAAGAAFWQAHAGELARAEKEYGVPAEIVVAIIGVETFYGRFAGGFRVLDALATLSFDFPTGRKDRTPFFRAELEEFLAWCHREGRPPSAVKGSFAGAIGLPQFMPGSINRYAIDFDGDGHVDLLRSSADAVGSVANYLAQHGWQRGLATHFEVRVPVDSVDRAFLLAPDILPSFSAAQFAERGAALTPEGAAHAGLLALVELQNGDAAPSFYAGTQNFYAITRYNWSSYYAMAVIALAEAVKTARTGKGSPVRAQSGA
jgi:membrane-bound lytic murein transglycosylase B